MRQIVINVYGINELEKEAKAKALLQVGERQDVSHYMEYRKDGLGKILECLGFYKADIQAWYDGHCYRVSFSAAFSPLPNWRDALVSYAPKDSALFDIGVRLEKLTLYVREFKARIVSHCGSQHVSEITSKGWFSDFDTDAAYTDLKHICNDICEHFSKCLNSDYDYCTSDEFLSEEAEMLEMLFTADGKFYCYDD